MGRGGERLNAAAEDSLASTRTWINTSTARRDLHIHIPVSSTWHKDNSSHDTEVMLSHVAHADVERSGLNICNFDTPLR